MWLADCIYRDGRFETGRALCCDDRGRISGFDEAADAVRFRGRAMLPGLVNVHSHTFQRAIRGRTERRSAAERDTFWTWREAMYHAANARSHRTIYMMSRGWRFSRCCLPGLRRSGSFITCIAMPTVRREYDDPNLLAKRVIEAARDVGIRIHLQRTAYVRAGWRKEANPGQTRFLTPRVEDFCEAYRIARGRVSR